MSATTKRKPAPVDVEFHMGPAERAADGHLTAWARAARDAYDTYRRALERDPEATVILTVSVQP